MEQLIKRWSKASALIFIHRYESGERETLTAEYGIQYLGHLYRRLTCRYEGKERKKLHAYAGNEKAFIAAHYNIDMSAQEIAMALGISYTALKGRIYYWRKMGLQLARLTDGRMHPTSNNNYLGNGQYKARPRQSKYAYGKEVEERAKRNREKVQRETRQTAPARTDLIKYVVNAKTTLYVRPENLEAVKRKYDLTA